MSTSGRLHGAPAVITHGAHELITSTRFAEPLSGGIASSKVVVFGRLSHPGPHENVEALDPATLDVLLLRRLGPGLAHRGSAEGS